MLMTKTTNINYRPDIDGLRAIAIIYVLLFHFYPKDFAFGFMGVDIFFVISGYLVTSIISHNILNHNFSFLDFYLRRMKRIFPPLVLMLLVVSIASFFLLTADELKNFGKHLLSGAGFVANYTYYSESGYFDDSSELKPLLHLWSLAIEEQFYLFWPILLWLGFRFFKKYIFYFLLFVCLGSFWFNIDTVVGDKSLAFYSLHTRLWELGVGGVLALFPYKVQNIRILAWNKIGLNILAFIGLVLLFLSAYIYDNTFYFPSWFALLPTMGTVLIIFAGENSLVAHLLKLKPLVFVGIISYSLYLWHWPILSLARTVTRSANNDGFKAVLFFITLLLSIFTYYFIERVLKKKNIKFSNSFLYFIFLFVLAILGGFIWYSNGIPQRYDGLISTKVAYNSLIDTPHGKWCNENVINVQMCSLDNMSLPPTVALIGDSHANHLFPGLSNYYKEKGENLLLLAKTGVVPFYDITSKISPDNDLNAVFQILRDKKTIHTVILSAFWSNYFEQVGTDLGFVYYKNPIEDKLDLKQKNQNIIFTNGLVRTLNHLKNLNLKIIFMYDIPIFPFHVSTCQSRYMFTSSPDCMYDFTIDYKKQVGYRTAVKSAIASVGDIVTYDPVPVLCPENICTIMKNKNILYSDSFHLSIYGSNYVVNELFK